MTTPLTQAPDITEEDYLLLGLATCYYKEDGEVSEVQVI